MEAVRVILPTDGYEAGDVAEVDLDGAQIADVVDLYPPPEPPDEVYAQSEKVYHGMHTATVRTRDAAGNVSDPASTNVFIDTGPRPPRGIQFASQPPGGGPLTFSFTPSPEFVE
jgi:hypothetical protein